MNSFVPPVVDHAKRANIESIRSKSPFSILNIVAVVAILIIGYFLYKKFTQKFNNGAIKIQRPPRPRPAPKVTFKKPVVEESSSDEEEEEEVPVVEEVESKDE